MDQRIPSSPRLLHALERLLELPTGDLKATLIPATDLIAQALDADKVDAFLYDPARDSLSALSSSNQPLSALQRKLGLDVLPVSNGARAVWVYKAGQTFVTGQLTADDEELRGVKEGLRIESLIGVPLEFGGARCGMVMIACLKRDAFSLRNYLAPIYLRLQWLHRLTARERREEELREIELACKGMNRLRSLVADLLDVARLEHGVFRIDPESVDLASLVEESAHTLARQEVRVDVRVQSTGKITVPADAARLRQCLDNLIANAIEQSPAGGTVTVVIATQTQAEGEYARVEIIDERPGVSAEILPHIFDRLRTGKPQRGGLGLGLYLAKRIAELQGGDLTVQSTVGEGARFMLGLPCRLA